MLDNIKIRPFELCDATSWEKLNNENRLSIRINNKEFDNSIFKKFKLHKSIENELPEILGTCYLDKNNNVKSLWLTKKEFLNELRKI